MRPTASQTLNMAGSRQFLAGLPFLQLDAVTLTASASPAASARPREQLQSLFTSLKARKS